MPPWVYPELFDPNQSHLFEGFVYEIENLETGRKYIGKKFTKTKRKGKMVQSDWLRYWGSSTDLCLDIKRLGHDRFRRTILYFCLTRAATNFHETEELFTRKVLSATLPNGEREFYNKNIMGKFFVNTGHTEVSKSKIAAARLGKKHTSETKRKCGASGVGRKPSVETLEKMRAAQKGRKHSPETIEKMRVACGGFSHTADARAKIRAAGEKLSEDQVRAIRSSTERKQRLSEQYGISITTIYNIRKGHTYAWVTP